MPILQFKNGQWCEMTPEEIQQEKTQNQQKIQEKKEARKQRLQQLANDYFLQKKAANSFDGKYAFQMVIVPDDKKNILDANVRICLSDEDYKKLLFNLLDNRSLKINDLPYTDLDLFKAIDCECCNAYLNQDILAGKDEGYIPPYEAYVIIPSEAMEDVTNIIGEPDADRMIYSATTEILYLNACVCDGLLGLYFEKQNEHCYANSELYDIDARTVQHLLHCKNYAGMFEEMKRMFGYENGIELFRNWLVENNVAFEMNEE